MKSKGNLLFYSIFINPNFWDKTWTILLQVIQESERSAAHQWSRVRDLHQSESTSVFQWFEGIELLHIHTSFVSCTSFCDSNPFTSSSYLCWGRPLNNSIFLPVETAEYGFFH